MPGWPFSLPRYPLSGSFSEQRQRNVAAFSPEVGPPKMRRRSTAVAVSTVAAFILTDAQLAIFDSFYESDLVDGTLPFDWPHPRSGVSHSWVFEPAAGPQKENVTKNATRVTCNLIRLP